MNSYLAAHRRRLLLDAPVLDYYPANGDVLVPRFPAAAPVALTVTRAGTTATRVNASGDRVSCAANTARIDYDPDTGRCLGLLVEESRINHFLNSDAPVTQDSASLGTGKYTLWMEGTGSVAVAGKTATISGGGTATDGTPVTFQVTVAGTVTYTVTGSPTRVQAENGPFATSYIPTAGSSATRNADVVAMTGTDFSNWYDSTKGTFLVEAIAAPVVGTSDTAATARSLITVSNGAASDYIHVRRVTVSTTFNALVTTASVNQGDLASSNLGVSEHFRYALTYTANDMIACRNGTLTSPDTSVTLPTVDRFHIGTYWAGSAYFWCGHILRIRYYNKRIPNDQLQLMTTAW